MRSVCDVQECNRLSQARGLCHTHYERRRRGRPLGGAILDTPEARFWAKVEKGGHDDCWLWTGATGGNMRYPRYGRTAVGGRSQQAHWYAYEQLIGPVPEGLELDHLCRVSLCVNPAHLEPVTHHENILRGDSLMARNARKTHCKRGHPFDASNTVPWYGGRRCRACGRLWDEARRLGYRSVDAYLAAVTSMAATA